MNTLVVYDSQFGNTQRLANAIAQTLREYGAARAVSVNQPESTKLEGVDMLILGCPTQGWRPTPAIASLLENIATESWRDLKIACFDTRFHKPRWLTGSAAVRMAHALQLMGIAPIMPPESFFVTESHGPLASGEEARAVRWAQQLHEKVAESHTLLLAR